MYDLIARKKDGQELTEAEIRFMVEGYTDGSIPDYQMSAMAMAICLRGMTHAETAALTLAMAASGGQVDLSALGGRTVDKHSTGGVGDKTTLVAEPMAAACGLLVAKMSGRGLGFTGGTIDKLESIPGFRTGLTQQEFFDAVRRNGIAVTGQSAQLAPADKKLYALRDVTATVDSIPLIASSIMSKKLAAGAHIIELDVKCGSGAFMKDRRQAAALAREMVEIGTRAGRLTSAWITNMDQPLGLAVGNALEVAEAVDTLRGGGPADLRELCLRLCSGALMLADGLPEAEARARALQALESGAALQKLRDMVQTQGGDVSFIDRPERFAPAAVQVEAAAPRSGFLAHMDTAAVGAASVLLGAGRETKESPIDPAAGILLRKKTGDRVQRGEPLAVLYAADHEKAQAGLERFLSALTFDDQAPAPIPLILGHVTRDGQELY